MKVWNAYLQAVNEKTMSAEGKEISSNPDIKLRIVEEIKVNCKNAKKLWDFWTKPRLTSKRLIS